MKGSIAGSRAGCVSQMLFDDVCCSDQLSFVSAYMEIVVSFDDRHGEGTIIRRANRNLPVVIGDSN